MPYQSTVLRVFVASPSDVAEERGTLDVVIAELNRTWVGSIGVRFEVLKWETHVRPGFEVDPQAVVNAQIPDDYDVFIGIFWSRLGTPTGRAASGTIEEFEGAYRRFKESGSVPEIMLYFKEAPLTPSKIDAAQFSMLQTFKDSLSGRGGLYSSFEDQAGFEASLRAHLSAIAQKFVSISSGCVTSVPSIAPAEVFPSIEDEDYGLLDYLDIHSKRTQDMTAAMNAIGDATVRVGEQLSLGSSRLASDGVAGDGHTRLVVKYASEDMSGYADTLEAHLALLSPARQDAFSALSSALALMADFQSDQDQLLSLREALKETIVNTQTAKSGLLAMRQATMGFPRISKDLNKAKRSVIRNLDEFLAEIESTESTVVNIVAAMDRLMESER